jgi:hypothetical protein
MRVAPEHQRSLRIAAHDDDAGALTRPALAAEVDKVGAIPQRAHVWQAGHTARRFWSGRKENRGPGWNHLKNWMLTGRVFGRGDVIAIPLPNVGSMGGECWPLFEGAIAEKAVPSNLLQMGVSS